MSAFHRAFVAWWFCLTCAWGCSGGGSGDVKLAPADGTVTYQGKPLAGATVTFSPDKGPLAMGVTDLNGKFTLASGAMLGAAVGPAKVSVTAFPPGQKSTPGAEDVSKIPKNADEAAAQLAKMGEMQEARRTGKDEANLPPKSLIPEKYMKVDTSDLKYTVKPGGDNHFSIELTD